LLAVAASLVATVAVLQSPAPAASRQDDGAARLAAASHGVQASGVRGIAWYTDPSTDKVVVTVDKTVSKAEVASIRESAGSDAVEIRHASWNVPDFYVLLSERRVGIVNIDQPVFQNSIKPDARVTAADVGYVRLHGRNYGNWFRENAETHERYDYLYTEEELKAWLDRIHEVARRARDTYVITNNHFLGQAPANAAMLRKLDHEPEVWVPPELEEKYRSVLEPMGIRAKSTATQLEF